MFISVEGMCHMKKYILAILISFFLFVPSSKALLCRNTDKVKYSDMAKNVSVNYEYEEHDNDINFNIKISNIPEGFSITDFKRGIIYDYSSSELTLPADKNTTYVFNVTIPNNPCHMETLYKHYITIPPYNPYYKDEVCNDVKDYKLCDKWINIMYSYENWKDKVLKYKATLNNEKPEEEVVEDSLLDKIINFYVKYYIYILPTLVILGLGGMYLYNKKHDLF